MKRYEAHKDSGVKWIGEIPSHWETHKIKYLFKERSQKGYPDEPVLCATQKYGVIPQDMYENRVVVVNKGLEGLKLVREGDFVISLRSFQGGIEYAHYQGIISAAYTVLSPKPNQCSNYLKYLLKSYPFICLLKTCVTGIREGQNINYDFLRKQHLLAPPLHEQQAIADYLKEKISKIEQYVAERERERELLDSLKQSEIANVVTKGLNPNVSMKDSGIPWIGEIPAHWAISKIKWSYTFSTGATPNTQVEKFYEGNIKWVNISDMGERIIYDTKKKISQEGVNSCSMTISPKGSLLYSFKLSVGTVSFCGEDMYTNEAIATFYSPKNSLSYLYYMAPLMIIHNANKNIYGADILNQELIKNAIIPLPPLSEQQSIAAYLDARLAKIDQHIAGLTAEIEYLKEFKQRLISDAVTGQIKVTDK